MARLQGRVDHREVALLGINAMTDEPGPDAGFERELRESPATKLCTKCCMRRSPSISSCCVTMCGRCRKELARQDTNDA